MSRAARALVTLVRSRIAYPLGSTPNRRTMDSDRYRGLCSQLTALPRAAVEETYRLLEPEAPNLAAHVREILESGPIRKPEEHVGGPETDFFDTALPDDVLDALVTFIGVREADADVDGDPERSYELMDLLDAWNRRRTR